MYPNNSTPGTRATASTFSYLPYTGVDDRFGQFVIKFDTVAAGIPAGLGADNYHVEQLVLTAVYASSDSLPYDPTEDPLASFGAAATEDPDAGRPLELYGTGFRGGFTDATFHETSPFGERNAYGLSFESSGVARDVSNNVTGGFQSAPWAIATVSVPVDINASPKQYVPLAPGEVIPLYSHVTFTINLGVPGVAAYVRQGLNDGFLWLTLSSLHSVIGPGGGGFPAYFTRDHPEQAIYHDVAPTLDVAYSLPLQITGFSRDAVAKAVHLSWNGSPGFQYTVETSTDLAAASWSPVGTFTTATSALLAWNGGGVSPRAFFRIARTGLP